VPVRSKRAHQPLSVCEQAQCCVAVFGPCTALWICAKNRTRAGHNPKYLHLHTREVAKQLHAARVVISSMFMQTHGQDDAHIRSVIRCEL
jgi:hypothetical protein